MTVCEIALAYLDKGLSVIPLKSPEMVAGSAGFKKILAAQLDRNASLPNPRSKDEIRNELFYRECKIPIVGWKEFQTRLPTKEEVKAWFTIYPKANIGIVTGTISNLVVFDLDSDDAVLFADNQGGFPSTPKVKSGKGYHIYVEHPGFQIHNDVNKKYDLDIRADGGYIVAPPSIHGSGHLYAWEDGKSILNTFLAPCNDWMVEYLKKVNMDYEESSDRKSNKSAESNHKEKPANEKIQSDHEKKDYAHILSDGAIQGERNNTAIRLIGHLLKSLPKEEVWVIVKNWNASQNKPPLLDSELRRTFEDIAKMEQQGKVPLDIEKYLDEPATAAEEYHQSYVRVPFCGKNLKNVEMIMNGGLMGGRVYVLGGIPSSGKTVLANNIADNVCLNGYPVLFFSYDDGKQELRNRSLARFSNHGIDDYNLRLVSDIKEVLDDHIIKQIQPMKYIIQDNISVERWIDLVEQVRKKHGKGPVIIIDYLRKLNTRSKTSDERLRVDDIINKLTNLGKEMNIPILVISELARDSYKTGQRLSMASFKESGTIEYEASWLGILAAVEEGKMGEFILKENWESIIQHDGNIDLIVFKSKRGTGATGKIPLKIDKNKMTVRDRSPK